MDGEKAGWFQDSERFVEQEGYVGEIGEIGPDEGGLEVVVREREGGGRITEEPDNDNCRTSPQK